MEAQTIQESVPRIMFVTSRDTKIVDEFQVPTSVSMILRLSQNHLIKQLQAPAIDLADDAWKLGWVEDGGILHASLACGYGFWKVSLFKILVQQRHAEKTLQELPDSMSLILDAALVSLKNPELIYAAEESKIRRESAQAASANAEIAYSKSGSDYRLESDTRSLPSSGLSTGQSQDEASDSSSQAI